MGEDSGIYALWFEKPKLIYVGQSVLLCKRKQNHYNELKRYRHKNRKVQAAYTLFGLPEFIVLETCSVSKLNDREAHWIEKYNAINEGLNLRAVFAEGENFNLICSKHSKIAVLKVFSLLTKSSFTYYDIAIKARTSIDLVSSIAQGKSHIWLKKEYPNLYAKIGSKNLYNTKFISPSGDIYNVNSLSTFANSLASSEKEKKLWIGGLSSVKTKKRKSYRGWYLYDDKYKKPTIESYSLKSPEGEIFTVTNISSFVRDTLGIADNNTHKNFSAGLNRVKNKQRKSYKKWTLVENTS